MCPNSGVSYEGKNGEAEVGADGSVGVGVSATLNGIKNSVKVSLEGGKPVVSFGVAGSFGAVKVGTNGNKIIFSCQPKEIKKVVNGVEITGNLSYTLELTIVPNPPKTQPQSIWQRFTNALSSATQSVADFVYDNRQTILAGTAVVAVGAAIIMTGGVAAPALAVGSDRRLKRNITYVGVSPTGIPRYTFQYLDHDTLYHGVMAQDLQLLAPEALVKERRWDVCGSL